MSYPNHQATREGVPWQVAQFLDAKRREVEELDRTHRPPPYQPDARRRGQREPDQKIYDTLHPTNLYHNGLWGFAVIRAYHADESEWRSFQSRLNSYVVPKVLKSPLSYPLMRTMYSRLIYPRIPGQEPLSINDVRKMWKEHMHAMCGFKKGSLSERQRELTSYVYPIYVDREVIDSVINGEDPKSHREPASPFDNGTPRIRKAFVKIIDPDFDPNRPPQFTETDESDPVRLARKNAGDHGYSAIEGCRREDVGWMKVSAAELHPRVFANLMNHGWNVVYRRPPEIAW